MKNKKQTTWELYTKTIRMRAGEKRALRERIVSYMEYHPVRVPLRAVTESIPSPLLAENFVVLRFSSWQFRFILSGFVLFFIVAVPAYAEHAIPGDVLYTMKVHVNEEVKASLTWQTADKVAWQATRVERRIAEARLLAKEGKLTSETEASLAATVREHTLSATREIAVLRSTDAESAEVAQAGLSSTLDVQTALLATDTNSASTTASTSIDSLANTIKEVKVGARAHDPTLDASLSPEKLAILLESETTRARKLFENVKSSVSDTERTDIERRLVDTERAISEAKVMHEAGKRDEALVSQRAIFGDIETLVSYMSDIDLRTSVALETLVPKKFTSEEYEKQVSTRLEDVKNKTLSIHNAESSITHADIKAKYVRGESDLAVLITSLEKARSDARYDDGLAIITKIDALIADLVAMKDLPSTIKIDTVAVPATVGTSTPSVTLKNASSTGTTTIGR